MRMRGFAQRHTVDAALAWLDAQLKLLAAELVPLRNAAGRVLAAPVVSEVDVPGFDRATMDGYAVVAASTEGATPYTRLPLTVLGDSMPGCPYGGSVSTGEAVRVMTGAARTASLIGAPTDIGASDRGAFGFSNEKSLMNWPSTLSWGAFSCACGCSPPLVAMVMTPFSARSSRLLMSRAGWLT